MNEDASPSQPAAPDASGNGRHEKTWLKSVLDWALKRNGETARDALEELIEEQPQEGEDSLGDDERRILLNVLDLHEQTVADVMVPRVDIIALKVDATLKDVVRLITEEWHSRVPVYRETLDDAFGMVHAKDVLAWRGRDEEFSVSTIVRPVLFVAPSMHVLELLLEMRVKRVHMALVVDEFGGVDGLVTIEDLVEEIVGEIEDEFDEDDQPQLVRRGEGVWYADGRTSLEDFETAYGAPIFSEDEHDDVDTLGGMAFTIAGRVPSRGELLTHPSGVEFEILEADPRRIKRLRVRAPRPAVGEPDPGPDAAANADAQ
ncbi:MAG: HlyC/CorC family transporter [Alphaproteobacteria bacterium]|nr:HlyC/CorC family transporter [Alphaproteobacteria bacterium]MBF0250294.1 HlyC/CorC family transporter [Alphaproteobacteria bacterium]